MNEADTPQDGNKALAGQRKAVYARDASGQHRVVPSSGWNVEEVVTSLTVESFRLQAQQALQAARQGMASPLYYHMYHRRMDPLTLSQTSGIALWRVRRHLKSGPYKRLPSRLKARYADALGMEAAALDRLPNA